MHIEVDPKGPLAPSEQIARQVRFAVAAGHLRVGERLPSVRALAVQALVNPNTVGKAWRELEREGVLESRPGDGVFVAPGAARRCVAQRDRALRAELEVWIAACRASGLAAERLESWFESALGRREAV